MEYDRRMDRKNKWIEYGFLGEINGTLYKKPLGEKEVANEHFLKKNSIFGYQTNLKYMNDKFGKETAEKCLNNYCKSLNKESEKYFRMAFSNEEAGRPNDFSLVKENVDNSIIIDALKFGLKLN